MVILKNVTESRKKAGESPNILENAESIVKPFGRATWKIETRRFGSLWKR